MGVDQTSLDRIRNATFPSAKRGYDKQEVEKFLSRLADWLETGGGDESRSETVKRELERVGERTGAILSQAEDSAQEIIAEARTESERARERRRRLRGGALGRGGRLCRLHPQERGRRRRQDPRGRGGRRRRRHRGR